MAINVAAVVCSRHNDNNIVTPYQAWLVIRRVLFTDTLPCTTQVDSAFYPTRMGNEYCPKCSDVLPLGIKDVAHSIHFPPSSRVDVFHCLDKQLVWIRRRMWTEYCLSPHRSSGEDLQGHRTQRGLKTSTVTWPRLTWSCWRQEMQLRIDLSGECWLHIALCSHSGACNIGFDHSNLWMKRVGGR